jgi:hypothetical protein
LSYHDGKGWDGLEYSKMAEQIAADQPVSARAPFVYRIGTSFLAAKLFPDNLNFGFKFINICAGATGIYLLWFWLTLFISNKAVRILLTASYIFYWQAPLRLSFYYPYHADPLALVFLFAGLILLKYLIESYSFTKLMFFIVLTFTGVFFREICLIPALILFLSKILSAAQPNSINEGFIKNMRLFYQRLVSGTSQEGERLSVYIFPLLIGLTGIIITHFLVSQNDNYSFFRAASHWIYTKSILMYFHAWFLSIGTIFTIILYYYSENFEYLKKNKYMLYYLLIIIFISFAGGSDTERLIMWSIPVIYILIGNTVSKHQNIFKRPILLIIIILTQIVSIRAFLLLPDYPDDNSFQIPFLTPISNHFPLFNLWTNHGDGKILLISFAQYVTLALFLSYYIRGKDKNKKSF